MLPASARAVKRRDLCEHARPRHTAHPVSAGQAYLRAANYYRAAEFYLRANPADPRILDAYRKLRKHFLAAMQLTGSACQEVRIPYQGTTLRGYYFHAPGSAGARPHADRGVGF
jgi:hypothetical protein